MAVSEVEGKFNDFDGSIVSKADDFNGAQVQFAARTASVDKKKKKRDGHLKSPDFFEADKYPEIKFVGTLVKDGGKYKLKGDLTMHGVTKKLSVPLKVVKAKNGAGVEEHTYRGDIEINRKDWNLGTDSIAAKISLEDEVKLRLVIAGFFK